VAPYVSVAQTYAAAIDARGSMNAVWTPPFTSPSPDTPGAAAAAAERLDAVAQSLSSLGVVDTGERRKALKRYAADLAAEANDARGRASRFGSAGWVVDIWCDPAYNRNRADEIVAANGIVDAYDLRWATTRPIGSAGNSPSTLLQCALAIDGALAVDGDGGLVMYTSYAPALLAKVASAATAFAGRLDALPPATSSEEQAFEGALRDDGAAARRFAGADAASRAARFRAVADTTNRIADMVEQLQLPRIDAMR
jgi:hypothetical protein